MGVRKLFVVLGFEELGFGTEERNLKADLRERRCGKDLTNLISLRNYTLGRHDVRLIPAPIFSKTPARLYFHHFSVFFLQNPKKAKY